jgi:hypothetical protein
MFSSLLLYDIRVNDIVERYEVELPNVSSPLLSALAPIQKSSKDMFVLSFVSSYNEFALISLNSLGDDDQQVRACTAFSHNVARGH